MYISLSSVVVFGGAQEKPNIGKDCLKLSLGLMSCEESYLLLIWNLFAGNAED